MQITIVHISYITSIYNVCQKVLQMPRIATSITQSPFYLAKPFSH